MGVGVMPPPPQALIDSAVPAANTSAITFGIIMKFELSRGDFSAAHRFDFRHNATALERFRFTCCHFEVL